MIIVYPTDTVWGIGSSIFDKDLTLKVHKIKGSGEEKPLSIIFHTESQLREFVDFGKIKTYFPLVDILKNEATVLLPEHYFLKSIPEYIHPNSDKVGIRLASTVLGEELSKLLKDPITTTSLNINTEPPITSKKEAREFHKRFCPEAIFINSLEDSLSGLPSTILSLNENGEVSIVRAGAKKEVLEKLIGL